MPLFLRPGFPISVAALTLTILCDGPAGATEVQHLVAADDVVEVAVASQVDGGSSLAWVSDVDPLEKRIYLQRLDASGAPAGAPQLVYQVPLGVRELRLVADSPGNVVLLWRVYGGLPHASGGHYAAAFSTSGAPLWGPVAVTPPEGIGQPSAASVGVAASPAGGWLLGSIEHNGSQTFARVRRLGTVTGPGEVVTILDPDLGRSPESLVLAGSETRVLAFWTERTADRPGDADTYSAFARLLDGQGQPVGDIRALGVSGIGQLAIFQPAAAGFGHDRFFVAWNSQLDADSARSIGGLALAGDLPTGSPLLLRACEGPVRGPLGLAIDRVGRAILAWNEPLDYSPSSPVKSYVHRFAVTGAPLSERAELSALTGYLEGALPAVATSPDGHWLAAWPRIDDGTVPEGIDGLRGAFADGCATETHALCLTGNRFRATANYYDHLGREGVGYAAPLTSESGAFWFFTPESVELILKIVDACSHPDFGNFWVFASGLTDVQVHLEVVDTWSGATWERDTALGEPFPPALDTAAFDTCGATSALVHP